MNTHLGSLLGVGAAVALSVGLLSSDGWVGFVYGAAYAGVLLLVTVLGDMENWPPSVATYTVAALVGVALGFACYALGDRENGAWWAPGFIVAGVVSSGLVPRESARAADSR